MEGVFDGRGDTDGDRVVEHASPNGTDDSLEPKSPPCAIKISWNKTLDNIPRKTPALAFSEEIIVPGSLAVVEESSRI